MRRRGRRWFNYRASRRRIHRIVSLSSLYNGLETFVALWGIFNDLLFPHARLDPMELPMRNMEPIFQAFCRWNPRVFARMHYPLQGGRISLIYNYFVLTRTDILVTASSIVGQVLIRIRNDLTMAEQPKVLGTTHAFSVIMTLPQAFEWVTVRSQSLSQQIAAEQKRQQAPRNPADLLYSVHFFRLTVCSL